MINNIKNYDQFINEKINFNLNYLDFIINDFFIYIEEFEYKEKNNMCDVFVYHFIDFLNEKYKIIDVDIISLNYYLGNIEGTYYKNTERKNIFHIMLKMGDKYIDLTPEQFGINEKYKIYNNNDIKKLFLNINIIDDITLNKYCKGKIHF